MNISSQIINYSFIIFYRLFNFKKAVRINKPNNVNAKLYIYVTALDNDVYINNISLPKQNLLFLHWKWNKCVILIWYHKFPFNLKDRETTEFLRWTNHGRIHGTRFTSRVYLTFIYFVGNIGNYVTLDRIRT